MNLVEIDIDTKNLSFFSDLQKMLREAGLRLIIESGGRLDRSSGPVRVRYTGSSISEKSYTTIGGMIDMNTPKPR
jgi:hypothetical protein